MRKKRVYLDTSFFVAEFNKDDKRHKILTEFIDNFKKLENVEFCYSKWCLTEMYNVLNKGDHDKAKIERFIRDILDKNKVRGLPLKSLDVSPGKNYDFNDLFNDLGNDLVKFKTGKDRPGLGDIIHVRIMKNNRIKIIFTFDSHFENVPGIESINAGKVQKKAEEIME